jgi:hypothetical protein
MPFTSDWEEHGLFRRIYGVLTPGEVVEAMSMLETDARFDKILYVINDCRDADVGNVSDDFLKGFRSDREVAAILNPHRIIANVLSTEDAERIRRLHDERYSGLVKMKTFASIDEAREWVNEWVRLQGR